MGSLRDAYSPPVDEWTFVPSPASSTPSSAGSAGPTTLVSTWSASPPPSKARVLDLSPYSYEDIDPEAALDTKSAFRWLVSAAALQYATTGIAMPFEVAKILMQCQWIPKDAIEGESPITTEEGRDDDSEDNEDSTSEVSAESYFHDPAREAFSAASRLDAETSQKRMQPTDADGYVLRQSVNDESTRPDYVMAVGRSDGVWTMIRRIREFKPEGWSALWKSQLTSTILETLTPLVQAGIQTFLSSIITPESIVPAYPLPLSRLPPSHLALSLASHVITGVLLSPLDLVRTRLIVQSSHPSHKTYTGPIHALRSAIKQEGGIRALYTHPSYLMPALLDNTLRPLLTLSTPILLHRWFSVEEDTHPMSYAMASCACASAALIVTLPVETIRRRMQVQSHSGGGTHGIQACIELSPRPYVDVLDTAWRIIKEERASPRRRIKRPSRSRHGSFASNNTGRRDSFKGKENEDITVNNEEELEDDGWFASTGIAQLYRGFSMGLTANVVVFALGAFSGFGADDGSGSGWTEL